MLIIQKDISKHINDWLKEQSYSTVFVLVDENTKKNCLDVLSIAAKYQIIQIKSGEENKNLKTCNYIWNKLLKHLADRSSLLINLGGGVIGDMGGFCASTFKRGIDFINIPTTLLAQVDASIGSKTGIDFENQKNMIGLFSEPKAVFIDQLFLKTLDKRQIKSGFAEVLKHGLIQDKAYFTKSLKSYIAKELDWNKIVKKSIEIKSKIVGLDPNEKGLRKILNFGHTIGHALESYSLIHHKHPILHGEAVILGIVSELFLSYKKGFLSIENVNQTVSELLKIYNFSKLEAFDFKEVLNYVLNDKKNQSNKIQTALLLEIGKASFNYEINKSEVLDSLIFLKQKLQND